MGQRLNLEIRNNAKALANCYYHWSGYTTSSLQLTKVVIDYMKEHTEITPDVQSAIKLLEATGASFNIESWGSALGAGLVSGEYKGCKGRNEGLIAVTEEHMKATRDWQEGSITINLENHTFRFECAWENNGKNDDEIWERVRDLFYSIDVENPWTIPFYKIDSVLEGVKLAEESYSGRFCLGSCCYNSIY